MALKNDFTGLSDIAEKNLKEMLYSEATITKEKIIRLTEAKAAQARRWDREEKETGRESFALAMEELASWIKDTDIVHQQKGQVYEVEIPEDDVMLFEGKRFNEQSPKSTIGY